jgi:glucose/arabinose dehydrogenase
MGSRSAQVLRPLRASVSIALALSIAAACSGGESDEGRSGEPDGRSASTSTSTSTSLSTAAGSAESPDGSGAGTGTGYRLVPIGVELDEPLDVASGDDSLFVVERAGNVEELVPDGSGGYESHELLDLRDEVGDTSVEKGLLGVEVTADGDRLLLNHTRSGDGATVIASYDLEGEAGSREVGKREELLVIDQPYPNHNGGDLALGPDGMLWIGTGDGGAAGDPQGRAQRLDDRLGKLLRLDLDSEDLVAEDNPYADGEAEADPLIWARGLRNPWRFSFDPETGDLWIGDVGQGEREEIDVVRADDGTGRGADFGWDRMEGDREFEDVGPTDGWPDDDAEVIDPFHVYSHDEGGCSVVGGYLYRGEDLPDLQGDYLFSDYCLGVLRSIDGVDAGESVDLAVSADQVVSINPDERGEPLVLHSGGVSRLEPAD